MKKSARTYAALLATLLICLLTASPAAAAPDAVGTADGSVPDRFLSMTIESLTPSVVTSGGAGEVTVTGEVHNVGDRMLHDLTIRLERGDAVTDADELRSSLAVLPEPVSVATPFREFAADLSPGQSAPFRVTAPLSGTGGLGIQRTGVYPMQVNINGLPDYGNLAKLAESRTLLPVLSLPPDRVRAGDYVNPSADDGAAGNTRLGPDGSVSANLSSPAALTLLWPLAAPPQLAAGVLGGNTEPIRLVGDDLAQSLAAGGRLHTLLAAARSVVGDTTADDALPSTTPPATSGTGGSPAPPSGPDSAATSTAEGDSAASSSPARQPSRLQQSMCLAIDPDLLVTVRAMSLGYEVASNPFDPTSATTPGTGQSAALQWLTELRELAAQLCVVALPFAQADLTSLARIDNVGLTTAALAAPADIVDAILGVHSIRDIAVPALGAVDDTGAGVLTDAAVGTAVTSTNSVAATRTVAGGDYRIGTVGVQTTEMPITAALAALGEAPTTPPLTPPDQQVTLDDESALARRQAAVASLAYPAIAAPAPAAAGSSPAPLPTAGRSAFIVPPTYWAPSTDDTNALFNTATLLLESGVADPAPLGDLVTRLRTAAEPARLVAPPDVAPLPQLAQSVSDPVATTIGQQADLSYQLQASLVQAADVAATPERYIAPLREDLLRAIRTPDESSAAVRADLTQQRADRIATVGSTLQRMTDAVTLLDPGGRYTLASERSPLLLVVRNDLSLPIRVRVYATAPNDLDVGDIGVFEIPARGTRQIQLPTRAGTSEAMTVTLGLTSSSGVPLGSPVRLSVHSNAYGKSLFWITIAAAVVLVLLTARRLWHRFRGQPDPADVDRPDPDEHDRLLAGATYQQRRRTLHQEMHGEHHDTAPPAPDHPPRPATDGGDRDRT
ncbi:hypothetical protein GORHZ_191_00380 [Gordonia rhizosphera NBRC 16068]|uniref:Glycoprotein n=1 Tax=Gordonia rhizosphera NBRC 16068 TaxID=1108045 RepID=K6X1V8_9ACTN|nr:DUF6049 family protein [Gordonia rhizosphera]GAB92779.1 hypothetical protein GORHZ_191_00380 [Gordonia rhizosphera NBRC 16068]